MPQYPSTTSLRPTLTPDATNAARVISPDPTFVGAPNPFGRGRMLTALPTNGSGPAMTCPALVIADSQSNSSYLVDPEGNFVGERGAGFVHRLLTARWVEDTRRLGG